MPIDKPNNNLYRIRELAVNQSSGDYYLSMNPGKAQACVLCICRTRLIRAEDLTLTEDNLSYLYSGGKLEFEEYTLQGITGHQLAALAQYRNLHLQPPSYIQAWSMAATPNGTVLYIPEDPQEQMALVPVHYRAVVNSGTLRVTLDESQGYADGDLMYQIEDHLPIPIPKSWINLGIPLGCPADKVQVIPAQAVSQNYIQKRD